MKILWLLYHTQTYIKQTADLSVKTKDGSLIISTYLKYFHITAIPLQTQRSVKV